MTDLFARTGARLDQHVDDALDTIDALLDRVHEHRNRSRVVLWGGKPGRDLQFGGIKDKRRQAILNGSPGDIMRMFVEALTPGLRAFGAALRRASFDLRPVLTMVHIDELHPRPDTRSARHRQVDADLARLRRELDRITAAGKARR